MRCRPDLFPKFSEREANVGKFKIDQNLWAKTVVPRFVTNYDRKSFLNPPAALTRTSIWLLLHGKRQLRLMGPLCQKHYDIFRKSLRNLKTAVPT
ncbi:hypothetical protein F2P81_005461 [Scophthalmus maximus]|uniref:Uncharacterized protein n=1 Tax=Scophthalmus maximus TaxID=52904 RepID=A0A6A4TAM0_SCOMX|nr:hypothetical protein F2P81_005461 [Scophthalmus maximus]